MKRIKKHLSCDYASCPEYLGTENENSLYVQSTDVYSLKQVLLYVWDVESHTFYSQLRNLLFHKLHLGRKKLFWKKKKQLRRHSPEFNGAELSKRPNRNLHVDPRNYSTLSMGSIISFFPFEVLNQYFGKKLTVSTVMWPSLNKLYS